MTMNRRRTRSLLVLTWLLLAALALAACGGSGTGGSTSEGASATAASSANTEAFDREAQEVVASEGGEERAVDAAGADTGSIAADAPAAPAVQPEQAGEQQQGFDRLVIRTGTVSLQVKSVVESEDRVAAIAATHGGYVSSGTSQQQSRRERAQLTITVPSENFDAAYRELRGLGKVLSRSQDSQDVTEEFVDFQSRQRSLEATEKSMLALLSRAKTVGEVLSVQRELTAVQQQLDQVKGRIKYLGSRTAMSTISVTLTPVPAAAPKVGPTPVAGWSALEVAERAWNASLRTLQGIATVVISVAVFAWWLLPLLLAAAVWYGRGGRLRRPPRPGQTAGTPQAS